MRWNETCTLVAKDYVPDDEGVLIVADMKTEVFCNPYTVGAQTWYSLGEMGISPYSEVQVRTCDYDGQRDVLYRGKWYSVEGVSEAGDFTRLILRHQMSDSDDSGESGESGV